MQVKHTGCATGLRQGFLHSPVENIMSQHHTPSCEGDLLAKCDVSSQP